MDYQKGEKMIRIGGTNVDGWEAAIRGMRNPMNSWDKSDSGWREEFDETGTSAYFYKVGDADLNLMKRLVKAGTDHSKFMRMINVSMDITAPLYWWKEFDTYKVGPVRNSCSTMHKIHAKEFSLDDFSTDRLGLRSVKVLQTVIKELNENRNEFLITKEKFFWWQMIQLLPSSYNQTATIQLNYAVLRNMYRSRKAHKLDEWKVFCKWVETLPYSELITMEV